MSILRILKSKSSRKVFWFGISEAIGRGSIIIGNIYLARILGAEAFGVFALAQIIVYYFWFAVDLGTTMYGIREISQAGRAYKKITDSLLTMRIIGGAIVYTVLFIIIFIVLPLPAEKQIVIIACGSYLIFYALYPDWIAKGLESFSSLALSAVIYAITFIGGLFLVVKNEDDLLLAALIWPLSYVMATIVLYIALNHRESFTYKPAIRAGLYLGHMKESIYFTISSLFGLVYYFAPVLLIALFESDKDVGVFMAPFRIVLVLSAIGFVFIMSFYPSQSALYLSNPKYFMHRQRKIGIIITALSLPIVVVSYIFAEPIVLALFGDEYAKSVVVFKVIIWLIPFYYIRNSTGVALQAAGFQKKQSTASMLAALTSLVVGFILIPMAGIIGAALTIISAELIFTAINVYYFMILTRLRVPA